MLPLRIVPGAPPAPSNSPRIPEQFKPTALTGQTTPSRFKFEACARRADGNVHE